MITADFYPTQTTQFNTQYTDTILNLNYSDPEKIAAPYYMGYISYDDIPSVLKASYCKFVYNDAEAYVEFIDITNAENVPWFFTGLYSTSGNTIAHCCYRVNPDTNKYVTNTSGFYGMGHWGFLNSLEIERVSYRPNFSLTFTIQFLDMSTTPPVYDSNTYVDSDGKTFSSYSEIEDFLSNTTPLTFTYTKYGETYTAEIYARDIESGYCEITTPGGYLWKFYLTDFSNFNSERDVQPNGNYANYSNIGVGTLMHYNHPTNGVIPLLNNLFSWHYPPAENRYLNIVFNNTAQSVSNGRWIDSWTALGGFQCKIPYTFFLRAANYQVARFGNSIIVKLGTDINHLKRVFSLGEVLRTYVDMFTRLTTTATTSYGFNDNMKIPLFSDDNSPLWDYVSGELEDIQSQLQPWQYTNITTNTFTEYDIPDYHPPGPTPGPEGEESGDRIPNNERYFSGAYNFVTQYAMTRQQLGQFGNLLWSSWADQQGITDMWKNFKMFISADPASDTGSIDIASVMDFILSLQVFPFDLSSLLHTDSSNVCIGTGQYPLSVSGKKLLTINHILDCGTKSIPRPYNDFRDYENMSITAYLPYCGSVELNPGDVVGRSVSIEYSVDTLSGSCTAVLTAYDDDGYLYNVGMINGQISASIPITATNSGQIRAQRISDVASLAGLAGNTFIGNISQGAQVASGADSNPIGAISSAVYGTAGRSFNAGMSAQQMFAKRFSRGAISCPTLAGGNGIAAFYQPACPYIQMRYGLYEKPANYDHSVGGVSATSNPLSTYRGSGFTVCENVDISGLTCHEEERSAIKALLESGVYL